MSKKFWYLTKMSLNKKIKSKWFIGVNILFAILLLFFLNVDKIVTFFGGDFDSTEKIVIVDETKQVASSFASFLNSSEYTAGENTRYQIAISEKTETEETKKLKKENQILVVFQTDQDNYLKAKLISYEKMNALDYQVFVQAINQVKSQYALSLEKIDPTVLGKLSAPVQIERTVLNQEKNLDEKMNTMMETIFPMIILPFFMLIIFLVQMIGADICEEKSTRSMEIIISNVSPKVHFASKIAAANLFVLIQGAILLGFTFLAFLLRNYLTNGSLLGNLSTMLGSVWNSLATSSLIGKLWYFIPLFLLLMILSFIVYSLLAGILASVTTNMEDFQQIQMPIMLLSVSGYYLAIMAALFEGSLFIRILSYIPFVSCLLSPALFMLGEIGVVDLLISILMLLGIIFLFVHYGMRIYKAGILNYSNEKVWTRLLKTVKNKDV